MNNYQIVALVLSIVGVFGVLALGVNAFFLRGIFADLGTVKVKLAEISARSDAKEARLDKIEENEKETFKRLNEIEKKETCK